MQDDSRQHSAEDEKTVSIVGSVLPILSVLTPSQRAQIYRELKWLSDSGVRGEEIVKVFQQQEVTKICDRLNQISNQQLFRNVQFIGKCVKKMVRIVY